MTNHGTFPLDTSLELETYEHHYHPPVGDEMMFDVIIFATGYSSVSFLGPLFISLVLCFMVDIGNVSGHHTREGHTHCPGILRLSGWSQGLLRRDGPGVP